MSKNIELATSASWPSILDGLSRSFEANSRNPDVFAVADAVTLERIALMIRVLVEQKEDFLPSHFGHDEKMAYRWLLAHRDPPWTVDLVTKMVSTPDRRYVSLVDFMNECKGRKP
mgnify:FL=1|jgi:hypothetical protein